MAENYAYSTAVITTSLLAFASGFGLGIYSIRGYLIPPSLSAERKQRLADLPESDESDVDEGDTVLDHAPNWANGAEADRRQGLRQNQNEEKARHAKKEAEETHPRQTFVNPGANEHEECKLVLVVRTDLGMTKGKIAAQCSHATLACYKTLSRAAARKPRGPEASLLQRWERLGQAKIAVQVKSQDELLTLMGKACSLGVTAEVIQDAGRTQIDPGSMTVLGVGPAPKSLVDQVTGGLKLL
ncbi:PTH2-domain-containing protein [Astrocystis sublimbata]|nr:PTH2-domain-containing protein [Astrocystis sublimbata]